jgi:hypothetical protein
MFESGTEVPIARRADGSGTDDGLTVFCLASAHRADLVEAGTVLGTLRHGSTSDQVLPASSARPVSLSAWHQEFPADFQRTCTALAAAQKPVDQLGQSGALESAAGALLPLVAGALITALAGEWVSSAARGREAALGLRAALDAAQRAVSDYLGVWSGGNGDPEQLGAVAEARLADFRSRLDPLIVRRRHARAAAALRELTLQAPLGTALTRGWRAQPDVEARRREVLEHLREVGELGNSLALALETPHRPHLLLHALLRKAPVP